MNFHHRHHTATSRPSLAAATGALFTLFAVGGCDAGGIVTVTGGTGGTGGEGGGTTVASTTVSTVTTVGTTTGGGGDGGGACGPGTTACDDVCVNTTNDPDHCGGCGDACADEEVCTEGACGLECVGGSTECDGLCVDVQNDPANCGDCGEECAVGEVCSDGACGAQCVGGSTECGNLCVDLQNDPANCGACGEACAADEVCALGSCSVGCPGGTTLCGALCVDLQTDPANCSACGAPCGVGGTCAAGVCSDAPTVIDTTPDDGAVNVAVNARIEAVFSEPMDPLTIDELTFLVTDGATSIDGDVSYLGDTATFIPAMDYPAGTFLTVTITTGAEDLGGQPLAQDFEWTFETGTMQGLQTVELGEAGAFAILAFDTVTNVVSVGTVVTGDLGISPGAALTGFPPGVVIGDIHAGDVPAADAKEDLLAAYLDAAGRLNPAVLPGDMSGLTFTPGLYGNQTSTMLSAGNVTLDAQGDANAVFIFQMGSTLTTEAGTQVVLAGGAKEANIFWAVGTSATLGTNSIFKGTILAQSAITMTTGGVLDGRLLAMGAAVALDQNLITVPLP